MDEGQFSLRGLVQGCGTDYDVLKSGIGGLGTPDVYAGDTRHGDRDGDVGSTDTYQRRILTFPLTLHAPDDMDDRDERRAYVTALLPAFKAAWARVPGSTDLALTGPHMAGMWAVDEPTFYGRPRPMDLDLSEQANGVIHATPQFVCLDPLPYGPVVTVTPGGSPLAEVVAGLMPSYRFTITITGNGGTPSLTATTDDGRIVTWAAALAGGDIAVLDFYTQTLTVNGVAAYPLAVDEWFRLLPGANSIAYSGCAGVELAYRAAYL